MSHDLNRAYLNYHRGVVSTSDSHLSADNNTTRTLDAVSLGHLVQVANI